MVVVSKENEYWNLKHSRYAKKPWIDKPSYFAREAIRYFPKGGYLLDLGAGQGRDSRFFERAGFSVLSTDFNPWALKRNKKLAEREGLGNLEVSFLDLSKAFPFSDNTFDIVYSHLGIHYFADKTTQQIFDEIFRVLSLGGIVAVMVNSTDDPEYGQGNKIEKGFFLLDKITKRYFSKEYMLNKVRKFEVLLIDDKGRTYKDRDTSFIRFVGRRK